MSFVEKQLKKVDTRVIDEIKSLRLLFNEKLKEVEEIGKRLENIEIKYGLTLRRERKKEKLQNSVVQNILLIDSEEEDIVELLFVLGEDIGEIVSFRKDEVVSFLEGLLLIKDGTEIELENIERSGRICIKNKEGEWELPT